MSTAMVYVFMSLLAAFFSRPICNGVSFKKSLDVIVSVMAEFKYLSQDQSISQRHPLSIDCILRG
eukprot:m.152758 g.152758  ORF g.152758 m.152758 type:complete len:65 (+) comp38606_c0_seq12:1163-1357(+)